MEPKYLSPPHATYCPITGPSPHMRITPPTHSGLFHSWNEQFPPQEYLKELRILLFQTDLCNYQAAYLFKKGNYYFLFYNNCICFKSVYVHDMVICFSAGFSYSVLM
jgi:hypothetical protein